jgi:hypothetical protein
MERVGSGLPKIVAHLVADGAFVGFGLEELKEGGGA